MSIKWHQSQFALHFQPLSNQGSSEMCVCKGMCVVVMCVLSSPWCGPEVPLCGLYSMTANLSEAKELYAQSTVLLLLSTSSFLSIFKIS